MNVAKLLFGIETLFVKRNLGTGDILLLHFEYLLLRIELYLTI